jgi:hypothetical protein
VARQPPAPPQEVHGPPEGIALFVDTRAFDVLAVRTVRFADHASDVAHPAWEGEQRWRKST